MPYVLNVGLDPVVLGHPTTPQSAFPSVDKATVEAGVAAARDELAELGIELDTCFVTGRAEAESILRKALMRKHYDAVVIGAGIRMEPELTELFEILVNTVRRNSPQSVMCFNIGPGSTAAAVKRWWSPAEPAGPAD